jgi:predicted component of type VI protein secretion system
MRKGPMPGKVYELAKSVLTVGRDVKNDIVINDSEVSRQHVRLTEQENGYQVEDLASTNGTFVNSQRLSAPMLLQPRDLLGLGETIELEFGTPPAPDATVVAGPYSSAPDMPRPEEPVRPVSASPLPRTAPFGGSVPPSASAPASPFPAQEKQPVSPWVWGVGIGCGVLLLCACVSSVAAAFLWPQIQQMMR